MLRLPVVEATDSFFLFPSCSRIPTVAFCDMHILFFECEIRFGQPVPMFLEST